MRLQRAEIIISVEIIIPNSAIRLFISSFLALVRFLPFGDIQILDWK